MHPGTLMPPPRQPINQTSSGCIPDSQSLVTAFAYAGKQNRARRNSALALTWRRQCAPQAGAGRVASGHPSCRTRQAPRRGHRVPAPARDPPARRARAHGLRGPGPRPPAPGETNWARTSPSRRQQSQLYRVQAPRGALSPGARRAPVTAAPRDVPEDGRAPPARRPKQGRRGRAIVHAQGWKKTLSRMAPTPTFTLLAWRLGASLPA